jgi:hypothetical protein
MVPLPWAALTVVDGHKGLLGLEKEVLDPDGPHRKAVEIKKVGVQLQKANWWGARRREEGWAGGWRAALQQQGTRIESDK